MKRRDFLSHTVKGAGSAALLGALSPLAFADSSASCIVPWAADTPKISWTKKEPPYRIALSNSYMGNTWRSEMVAAAKLYAKQKDVAPLIKELKVASAGNDVNTQIAQINQMVLSGVDAIVTDAASPTALNSTIDNAANAGVLVVSFDNVVTTKNAIAVKQPQLEMGQKWADFVVEQIAGKGHVLMVRGVAGTFVDKRRYEGAMAVFGKHPGIKTTEVYGKWSNGVAQKVTANALAAGAHFDAVWSQGGDNGIIQAFEQAGAKVPPIAGEAENGFRKYADENQLPIVSIGQSISLSALSIKIALQMLQGQEMPRTTRVPLNPVTTSELELGKNYFADIPGNFFVATDIPACGLDFDAKKIYALM